MGVWANRGGWSTRVTRRGITMNYYNKNKDDVIEKEREMREEVVVRLTHVRYYFQEKQILVLRPMSEAVYREKMANRKQPGPRKKELKDKNTDNTDDEMHLLPNKL